MPERNYLGRGIQFPFQIDQVTGRICTSEGVKNVKESIYLILMTGKSERFLRPDFGTSLSSYTFTDTGITMLQIMSSQLQSDILSQEPRIADVSVQINPEVKPGCLIIEINYTIRAGNIRDNLVFPFYLQAGEDS